MQRMQQDINVIKNCIHVNKAHLPEVLFHAVNSTLNITKTESQKYNQYMTPTNGNSCCRMKILVKFWDLVKLGQWKVKKPRITSYKASRFSVRLAMFVLKCSFSVWTIPHVVALFSKEPACKSPSGEEASSFTVTVDSTSARCGQVLLLWPLWPQILQWWIFSAGIFCSLVLGLRHVLLLCPFSPHKRHRNCLSAALTVACGQ